ncbi:MAG TPA: lysophospholipid acyltransferase family protein [Pelomicrobium sp.]|nr:lysophospholipid acyltransferase family protein [Pelomicrobium sp.]
MLKTLLGLLAYLPLRWLHGLGSLAGKLVFAVSPTYASRLEDNLRRSGICRDETGFRALLKRTVAEAGRGAFEVVKVWCGPAERSDALVREVAGWEHVERALADGRGAVLLTPHLGCFEIAALYIGRRTPLTVLYRPPKVRWLEPLMIAGREKGSARLATTDTRGVRTLLKALKRGEAIGLLPDQAPGMGEGVWAPFFGRPAYTMTLAARLAQATGAPVIIVFARRLPRGAGYALSFTPLAQPLAHEAAAAARQVNAALEDLIRQCPEQYLWSYNRYKVPAGVAPPAAAEGEA